MREPSMLRRFVVLSLWALVGVLVLGFARVGWAVPDPAIEERCTEIDAMGGVNACNCSEPMISSGAITDNFGGYYNTPGNTTKPCGYYATDAQNKRNLGLNSGTASGVAATGDWSVPAGSGINYVLEVSTNDGKLHGVNSAVPTTVGRRCHRVMMRFDANFIGRNYQYGGTCNGVKGPEFDPLPGSWGLQFQGGWDCHDLACSDANSTMYFNNGGAIGSLAAHFADEDDPLLSECQDGWCGFEQCWYGDFSTGAIKPAYATYKCDLSGICVEKAHSWNYTGAVTPNPDVPIDFDEDWIANLYRELGMGSCGTGKRALIYAMSADFASAGTETGGPWIGPPAEMNISSATCGDGAIEGAETCDDGGTAGGDGCSANCLSIESGWGCTGEPSVCTQIPVAAFSCSPTSDTTTTTVAVTCTDASTNTPTSWAWDVANNGSTDSTSQNPVLNFAPGVYTIRLRATNAGGYDDETKTNYVTITQSAAGSGTSIPSLPRVRLR